MGGSDHDGTLVVLTWDVVLRLKPGLGVGLGNLGSVVLGVVLPISYPAKECRISRVGRIVVNLEFASDRACRSVFCEDELLDSAVLPERVDRASALIRSFRPATLNEAF